MCFEKSSSSAQQCEDGFVQSSSVESDGECETHASVAPIVLVPGFLGPAKDDDTFDSKRVIYAYWGEATKLGTSNNPVLCVWPSGFSSLHDRACEIFYQIKGGTVDYGEEHSARFGHSRYGRTYNGLFPGWSASCPIHFVGHSLGGSTLRVLEYLLHSKHFEAYDTSANWIRSMTAISAPLNGSLASYALGEREISPPDVVRFSPGWALGAACHVIAFFGLKPMGYDIGLDHWELSWRRGIWAGVGKLVQGVCVRSPVTDMEDNPAYDTTIHAMAALNARIGAGHAQTYYLSYVGTGSEANTLPPRPALLAAAGAGDTARGWALHFGGVALRRVFLSAVSALTNCRTFKSLRPYESFAAVDFMGAGDGLCSAFSQAYPRVRTHTPTASASASAAAAATAADFIPAAATTNTTNAIAAAATTAAAATAISAVAATAAAALCAGAIAEDLPTRASGPVAGGGGAPSSHSAGAAPCGTCAAASRGCRRCTSIGQCREWQDCQRCHGDCGGGGGGGGRGGGGGEGKLEVDTDCREGCAAAGECDSWCEEVEDEAAAPAAVRWPAESEDMPLQGEEMRPGVWYVERHGQDHMGIVPFPVSAAAQRDFFQSLFTRLRAIDSAERNRRSAAAGESATTGWRTLPKVKSDESMWAGDSEISEADTHFSSCFAPASPTSPAAGGRTDAGCFSN